MENIFNFSSEMNADVKQYLKAQIFGDIFVDVRVEFKPQWQPRDDKDKMALDMVNARLRMVSGEIAQTVREVIKDKLFGEPNVDKI